MVRIRARAAILFLLLPYAGCALAQSAPGFPSRPWHAAEEQRVEVDARNFHDSRFNIDPTKTYSLPELLDLAEAHNPETRVAWERARAQAAALGVEHSELYPTLAAVVLSVTGRSNVLFGNEFFPPEHSELRFPIRQTIKKGDSFRIAVIREASVMGDFMSPKRFPNIGSAPS